MKRGRGRPRAFPHGVQRKSITAIVPVDVWQEFRQCVDDNGTTVVRALTISMREYIRVFTEIKETK